MERILSDFSQFQRILTSTSVGLVLKDLNNNIIKVNDIILQKITKSKTLSLPINCYDFFGDQADSFFKEDMNIIINKTPILGIKKEVHFNEAFKGWLKLDKFPIMNDKNEVTYILAFVQNITEEVLNSKNKNELEALTEAIHNLKNYLSIAKASTTMLRKEFKHNNYLDKLDHAHDSILSIIKSSLELNTPVQNLNKNISVKDIVFDVIEEISLSKDMTIYDYLHVEVENDPKINIRPEVLKQVFSNLINNAIEELVGVKNKRIDILIKRLRNKIMFSIQDNGRGIPDELKEKIFENHFSTKNNSDLNQYGSGLGLSYVKRIVEANNGDILVCGELGRGAIFNIVFPAEA